MAVDIILHDEVKRRLKAKHVSFMSIASELSVSPSLVTMVCQGHRRSLKIAKAIAAHLDQEPSEIWATYGNEEAKMRNPEN